MSKRPRPSSYSDACPSDDKLPRIMPAAESPPGAFARVPKDVVHIIFDFCGPDAFYMACTCRALETYARTWPHRREFRALLRRGFGKPTTHTIGWHTIVTQFANLGYLCALQWLFRHEHISLKMIQHYNVIGRAAANGHLKFCQWLIGKEVGLSAKYVQENDNYAFRAAVQNGHLELCQWLMCKSSVTVDVIRTYTYSFRQAAQNGHLEVCQWLVNNVGMNPIHIIDKRNWALWEAASRGHLEVCQWIKVVAGPISAVKGQRNGIIAFHAASSSGRLGVCKFLVDEIGLIIDDVHDWNFAFYSAAANGYLGICKYLLDVGSHFIDITAEDNYAFCKASQHGHLDVCKYLVSLGLTRKDVRALCNYAFRWAAANGHLELCQWLYYEVGLTIDDVKTKDNWAFLVAAEKGHLELCQWLYYEVGLTIDDVQAQDNYAFVHAATNKHVKLCRWIVGGVGITYNDAMIKDNVALRAAVARLTDMGVLNQEGTLVIPRCE